MTAIGIYGALNASSSGQLASCQSTHAHDSPAALHYINDEGEYTGSDDVEERRW
jgi:hypothetical protein